MSSLSSAPESLASLSEGDGSGWLLVLDEIEALEGVYEWRLRFWVVGLTGRWSESDRSETGAAGDCVGVLAPGALGALGFRVNRWSSTEIWVRSKCAQPVRAGLEG